MQGKHGAKEIKKNYIKNDMVQKRKFKNKSKQHILHFFFENRKNKKEKPQRTLLSLEDKQTRNRFFHPKKDSTKGNNS